ncbi:MULTISPECIES: EAL domain-containing response regulator [Marinobacter]|jgi:diguanylate cyclase (GGDEF)-like protein|uniref:Diguanylate cyclase (GGDEF) domain-containing protein n=2 Tax=Marinobacter TaxID=2742 RepID=A0ABY1FMI8_9GAMM|nr:MULTISPECIES: GGDEF domain-containing response regulator [Marinobacter]MBL83762.1 GGDEF domain-containing response regulator [Marinobacter sp.]AZR40587.1 protein-glutamate O-methyltransferase [Marinobacter salarius]KXJ42770.1 MAG: diguanylate cyclase [Marinobacter sp. Hex_13]MBS8232398.1 GGDEF domain-containing response regulator [Marinobacter salarius]MDC8457664.1 GGDEF domain-containing response regulator [Marinobacter sp. DS40M6]|tara:strand:- start:3220 stop:4956 length:1737 start_codon:yes stop_codon:yes gene_type:complete
MTLAVKQPNPSHVRLLVLTPEYADFLWLGALLSRDCEMEPDLTWCPDLIDCDDLIRNTHFDVILWDCVFHGGSEDAFLQYLSVSSNEKPVLALSAEPASERAVDLLANGASDYLSRQSLEEWGLRRAVRCLWYRQQLSESAHGQLGREVASGFINRDLFFDRLQQALLRAERASQRLALLHINLDDFRSFNESFGYQKSDQIMLKLAERLRQNLRRVDSLMRIGGDEFAIIVEKVEDSLDITQIIRKLVTAMGEPFSLDGQNVVVSASLGVATYPEAGDSPENLLRRANRAMFEAKRDPGTSYRFYDRQLHITAGYQLRLEADLRNALRGNELEVYYQPRIDLASEEVRGVECLLRWNHPERGLVGPDEFIPVAERSGLIVPIGYWVIEQACKRLQECSDLGHPGLVFAVNLSFRQFHDRKMTETIFRIIFNANIDTSLLELELTESAMMHDPEYAQRCLRELNQLGISFALDDFGTGFSSLSNLQHLPISLVKIDKSFVQELGQSADAEHIIRAIISLAHSLQISVVAEGVETEGQLEFLRQQHCDEIQGYYYARPMPWADLVQFLDNRSRAACLQQ